MGKRLTRRQMLKAAAATGAGILLNHSAHAQSATRKPPNILFIMTDDHAAHALSCYGGKLASTPNLDRIAADGVRFDRAYCTNALCAPSRANFLTGKYSHKNGLMVNEVPFDGSQVTYPKLLQAAGYQTAVVGKWHLQTDPTGFDYWKILEGQGQYFDPVMIEQGKKGHVPGYVTDIIADTSIDFLKNRDKSRPFCLLCQHKAPHRSWFPDDRHKGLFPDKDLPLPETFDDDYATRGPAAHEATMRILEDLTPEDTKGKAPSGLSDAERKRWKYQRYIKDYLRVCASVDDNVGRLLDCVKAEGLEENTIVIYCSDNGFFLGDHGWFDKRFMYEESSRIPFLMRYPAEIKAGGKQDAFIINVDLAQTLLDYAGVKAPADMQGRSFRAVARGETPSDWRRSFYYHYYEYPQPHRVRPHYGVRTEQHKLIHFYDGMDVWELYDLKNDPHELRNVYGNADYAAVTENLKQEMARLRGELEVTTG